MSREKGGGKTERERRLKDENELVADARVQYRMIEAVQSLLQRISASLGINVNGFLAGIAVALFMIWSNQPKKPVDARAARQAEGAAASSTAAGADAKANGEAEGDLDEVIASGHEALGGTGHHAGVGLTLTTTPAPPLAPTHAGCPQGADRSPHGACAPPPQAHERREVHCGAPRACAGREPEVGEAAADRHRSVLGVQRQTHQLHESMLHASSGVTAPQPGRMPHGSWL
jgi:hypothetical protein